MSPNMTAVLLGDGLLADLLTTDGVDDSGLRLFRTQSSAVSAEEMAGLGVATGLRATNAFVEHPVKGAGMWTRSEDLASLSGVDTLAAGAVLGIGAHGHDLLVVDVGWVAEDLAIGTDTTVNDLTKLKLLSVLIHARVVERDVNANVPRLRQVISIVDRSVADRADA